MDTLHAVLRNLRGETKSRPDHAAVFCEFIDHPERIGRRDRREPPAKRTKMRRRRTAK
jgi:hypothetical protein